MLEEENERLKSENMELRNRGMSVPESPVDILDASLRRSDQPSSPFVSTDVCDEPSRSAKDISKKNGGRIRKPSKLLRTPYDACKKEALQRTKNKRTGYKRERFVADEIQPFINISKEEEDAIANFESKVGKEYEPL